MQRFESIRFRAIRGRIRLLIQHSHNQLNYIIIRPLARITDPCQQEGIKLRLHTKYGKHLMTEGIKNIYHPDQHTVLSQFF